MNTFCDMAREHGHSNIDGMNTPDQEEMVGLYLLREYDCPNEAEPIIESLPPEHYRVLYHAMADNDTQAMAAWTYNTVRMITKNYLGLTQAAMEEANAAPFWEEEMNASIVKFRQW